MSNRYLEAISRPDLSKVVVHFIQYQKSESANTTNPWGVLLKILSENKVLASEATKVNDPEGASCFLMYLVISGVI